MRIRILIAALVAAFCFAVGVSAVDREDMNSHKSTDGSQWVYHKYLDAGEDQPNNVRKVEQRFSKCIDDADIICNAAPAFLHSVSCFGTDATPTAGRVRITNTTAAGGAETTEVWGAEFSTTLQQPVGAVLDIEMDVGIVIDFTTTADVKCVVSYRDNA